MEKAAGPDGFHIVFFQRFFDRVKPDILFLFNQFYNSSMDLYCLKYALIALVLKKEGPCMVSEFWPISLLNAAFRIISRVIANRICPHIYLFVDQVQSAFTKNRYILDSVSCARQILAASHNFNLEAIFLKLDFENAFISVGLDFLLELLSAKRVWTMMG